VAEAPVANCDARAATWSGVAAEPATSPPCPECGAVGAEIARRTVVAVTSAPLPPPQGLRLCRTPDCSLVYYGDAGARIEASSLALLPPFKGGDVLCFCFLHRLRDLDNGRSAAVVEEITERVRAGDCACDLRNPTGKCCLPDIRRS
jgi:CopZ-like zinc binding protein